MKLEELRPAAGAKKRRKRVGRGPGSGHGKTATRGSNTSAGMPVVNAAMRASNTKTHQKMATKKATKTISRKSVGMCGIRISEIRVRLVAVPRYPAQLSLAGTLATSAPAAAGGRVN